MQTETQYTQVDSELMGMTQAAVKYKTEVDGFIHMQTYQRINAAKSKSELVAILGFETEAELEQWYKE